MVLKIVAVDRNFLILGVKTRQNRQFFSNCAAACKEHLSLYNLGAYPLNSL